MKSCWSGVCLMKKKRSFENKNRLRSIEFFFVFFFFFRVCTRFKVTKVF